MVYIGIYTFNYKTFKRIWVSYFEKEHQTLPEWCVYKVYIKQIFSIQSVDWSGSSILAGLNSPDASVKQAGTGPFRLCSCLFLMR